MLEAGARVRKIIPEETMLSRLAQSEQMREFFIQMWMQNPGLAKQGGIKVQDLMTRLEGDASQVFPQQPSTVASAKQRGISLVELIMFIVIVSVALAGILLVLNVTTKSSADPLVQKQALAAAQSLLEETELQDFTSAAGATVPVTQANRATQYHIVKDYDGFPNDATTGIYSVNGVLIAGLGNYKATVSVANAALGSITSGSGNAVLITVTVTDPQGNQIAIDGYRTAY